MTVVGGDGPTVVADDFSLIAPSKPDRVDVVRVAMVDHRRTEL